MGLPPPRRHGTVASMTQAATADIPLPPPPPAPLWRDGLRDAWSLSAPFWRHDRKGWWQLAVTVALTLAIVWLNVRFSEWNNAFYDALQTRDLAVFWRQLGVFGILAAAFIVLAVVRQVVQQRLVMHWRTGMTEQLLGRWLSPGTPYRLGASGIAAGLDNPDQRIADDIRSFVASSIDLVLGLLNATVTLFSFVAILWGLSGSFTVGWPAPGWVLPGYMVWVAIAYAGIGSWIVRRLGAPLVPTNARQQRVEADFRYALVQVRDHAEAIALARGEGAEHQRLRTRFDAIRDNWDNVIRYNKRLTWFSSGYSQLANIFPLLAAAPRYFSGQIQLGGLMQTAQAFGQVQGALSWFIDAYTSLADWRATVLRLAAFRKAVSHEAVEAPAVVPTVDAVELQVRDLAVAPPGSPVLLQLPELSLRAADWMLVTGPSGSGKSSMLRTLAGLWEPRSGTVTVPPGAMFVAQRPYLPHDSLAAVLAYPQAESAFERDAMVQALEQAELGVYAGQLAHVEAWSRRLSPGEQQRVQFARLFLHRPRWIVLDESTSALDEAMQSLLLKRLRAALPETGVLHVSHRSELLELHNGVLHVHDGVMRLRSPFPASGTLPVV